MIQIHKTWVRSTMCNMGLSSLAIIHIHKNKFDDTIIFEKQKTDVINYFGLNVKCLSLLFDL